MTSETDLVALAIALDPDWAALLAGILPQTTALVERPTIAVLQCFAIKQHLQRIVGAVSRAVSRRWLREVRVPIVGSIRCDGGLTSVTIAVQPTAELFAMQRKICNAIAPGIGHHGRLHEAADGFALLPAIEVGPFSPFAVNLSSASIYQVDPVPDTRSLQDPLCDRELVWRLQAV